MPIQLPQVDYGPVYRAIGMKGSAQQAFFGAQSLDIASRFRDLQRRQQRADLAYGVAQSVLQLGQSVYGLFEQVNLEKAKGDLHDLDQTMQDKVRTLIANNQFEWTTDASGNRVMKLDPELDRWYEQSVDQLEEKYKSFGRVRSWAKDQLYQMYDTGRNQVAMRYATEQGVALMGQQFETNLSNAMTDAINADDFAPAEGVISSAKWLGPEGQKTLLAQKRQEFELGLIAKDVRAIAAAEGYGAAATHVEGLGRSEPETQALLNIARGQQADTGTRLQQEAEKVFQTEVVEGGQTPAVVIDRILRNVPEDYRDELETMLRAKQGGWAHDRTTQRFNLVRDNLPELRELYEATKLDAAGWYDQVPEQQRQDLEMLSTEIAQKERMLAGPSTTEEQQWADTTLQYIWQSYIRGDINAHQAREQADRAGLQAHPAQYNQLMTRFAHEVSPQIEPIMKSIGSMTESALRRAWGLKEKTKLSPEQQLQLAEAAAHINRTAFDLFQENTKVSPAELSEKLQPLFQAFYATEYEALRKPIEEKVLESADRQLSRIQAMVDQGQLDDLVFEDLEGDRYFHPAATNNLQMLWAREQEILEEKLGQPVTMRLSPQGWDVGALSVFTDASGKRYVFRTEDGELTPFVLEGQELRRLEPKEAPSPPPKAEPIPEEYRDLLQNLGAQTLVPAPAPAARPPVIGPGMTPEEAQRAYRQLRGGR